MWAYLLNCGSWLRQRTLMAEGAWCFLRPRAGALALSLERNSWCYPIRAEESVSFPAERRPGRYLGWLPEAEPALQ